MKNSPEKKKKNLVLLLQLFISENFKLILHSLVLGTYVNQFEI